MNLRSATYQAIKSSVLRYPQIKDSLNAQARFIAATPTAYKSQDFYLTTLERLVTSVYKGNIGGDFIDVMSSLIQGQLTDAYKQAWKDEGNEGDLPDYLEQAAEEAILGQYDHVDDFYESIVDARVDETPLEPLLSRCQLWALRWTEAYNDAVRLIAVEEGENLVWRLGGTIEHCTICSALDGIVARASVWDDLNVKPQNAPNPILDPSKGGCGGWNCDCSLEITSQRSSPKAFDLILNIVS